MPNSVLLNRVCIALDFLDVHGFAKFSDMFTFKVCHLVRMKANPIYRWGDKFSFRLSKTSVFFNSNIGGFCLYMIDVGSIILTKVVFTC
jgi:hypothetical protein